MIKVAERQTGAFFKCELNVLVDMYLEGKEVEYIAEVLNRDIQDVKKQIKFKGLEAMRQSINNQRKWSEIVNKHCRESA